MLPIEDLRSKIHMIRGKQVMLDSDLADLYGVTTKAFNQAVKRNIARFPDDFMFRLTEKEFSPLRSQSVTLENINLKFQNGTLENGRGLHRKYLPYVFTEQGIASLSAILRSSIAIQAHISIMRAFVEMKKFLTSNTHIFQRLDRAEIKLLDHDRKFEKIFRAIEDRGIKPKTGIFFEGQLFDAHKLISEIIGSAKQSIVLIDNYIDCSTLTLFSDREADIKVTIYTKIITERLELDMKKHNAQYPPIHIKEFNLSHDRFMIIDDKEIYHIGASLKDMGKRWFAFSKMDKTWNDIISERLHHPQKQ